jgi:hypothetical protein
MSKPKRPDPLSVRLSLEEIARLNQDCQGYASRNDYIKDRLFAHNGQRSRKPLAKERQALATHLLNAHHNDPVEVPELRGFISETLHGRCKRLKRKARGHGARTICFP